MTASMNPKKNVASGETVDAIPMKKSNPMMVLAIIGGLAAVIGVVAFSMSRGKEKPAAEAPAAQPAAVDTTAMTPEEQKRHLEITQKSIAVWKEQKATEDAKKKAEAEAAKEKEAAAAAPVAAGGPAPAPAGDAPPPKKKPAASKKDMEALDGLGSDISSQLGK